jgi:NhaP-type Na+/H+ or K+/H+ antiporter
MSLFAVIIFLLGTQMRLTVVGNYQILKLAACSSSLFLFRDRGIVKIFLWKKEAQAEKTLPGGGQRVFQRGFFNLH